MLWIDLFGVTWFKMLWGVGRVFLGSLLLFMAIKVGATEAFWHRVLDETLRASPSMSGVNFRTKFIQIPSKASPCSDPSVVLPARPIGTFYVQLRCTAPRWTAQAQVLVETKRNYVALVKPLAAGAVLDEHDLTVIESDWGVLPEQVVESVDQALGKTLTRSLPPGSPLTLNSLRQTSVIRSGDRVRVMMVGKNFMVSGEGVSLGSAGVGDQVKVRMNGGQSVTGFAVKTGVIQVNVE